MIQVRRYSFDMNDSKWKLIRTIEVSKESWDKAFKDNPKSEDELKNLFHKYISSNGQEIYCTSPFLFSNNI